MQTSEPNISARALKYADWLVGAALFLIPLFIYLRTIAPSVAYLFDDSLEFQLLASRMAIAHPTGYPLYSILIKLATYLPFGDVAFRVNLVSAFSAAGAIVFIYLAAREIANRFFQANNPIGEILVRAPAVIAALIFAFGETFWSQAILAEVYTLQALFTAIILWLALRWGISSREQQNAGRPSSSVGRPTARPRSLLLLAFFAGLALTHHRMTVLLYPALALYVLSCNFSILKQPRTLLKIALLFVIPLLLYLYLPIRGTVTSSLDGRYQNTPQGFLNWILGTAYTVFLSQNPLNETRDAAYYFNLFVNDIGTIGLLVAVGGFIALFLRAWREWLLLALALTANLVFVLTYRVVDINVFFIPAFLITALFIAAGLAGLLWLAYYALPNRWATLATAAGALLLFVLPIALLHDHYADVDLSKKTDIIAYGRDVLAQPLPNNATIVGILGEMSLLRYLQETQNLRPDVETVAADKDQDRLQAIQDALKNNRAVFLTRPLSGLEKQASLTAFGPLVQVQPKANRQNAPAPMQTANADFGDVTLLGYDAQLTTPPRRVTLYWQPTKKITDARLVSLKLLDANGNLAGQVDRQPVLDAYPTTAWRSSEYIADAYDVPIFVGAAPGNYSVQVTLYDPSSGQVFGQQQVGEVVVPVQTQIVPRELLGVPETVLQDLGGVELSGYDLDTSEPFGAGANIPLTLLWRALQDNVVIQYDLIVADEFGKVVATQKGTLGGESILQGQYVRQTPELKLPSALAAGTYFVQLTVHGSPGLPFQPNTITLGRLRVKAP